MCAAKRRKRKSAASPAGLTKLVEILSGPARPLLVIALLGAAAFGVWYFVWNRVHHQVLSSEEYLVTPEKVEITPPPDWIHTDIRAEVFRGACLDRPLSIMDDDLTERIKDAFSLHPWVAKVGQVTKHHPARVKVDLNYRRPVCMVDIAPRLLPVDANGVLLPANDFSPVAASRYPRLLGIDTVPIGPAGESWGDARVVGGAEIADALSDVWKPWRLWQIVASPSGIENESRYALLTRGGTRIEWGLAPGSKVHGELPVADKLARLHEYVRQYGTLEGRGGPQKLDVYKLQPIRVSSRPDH